jgi:hypothetical protein
MSIENINSQVKFFLQSDTPEIIAINGHWGIGKTHIWNKLLTEFKDSIELKEYSYISLFGLNSIEELKLAIFTNKQNCKSIGKKGSEINVTTDSIFSLKVNQIKSQYKEIVSKLESKTFSRMIEAALFRSICKTIICIDDLERKGDKLSIKDVLGLLSLLKEEQQCKIVLLINENEKGLEDYFKYREKVIDVDIRFSPTVSENVQIAFQTLKFDDSELNSIEYKSKIQSLVCSYAEKLELKNIRILNKIKRLITLVRQDIKGCEDEVIEQVVMTLTLFSWCYYSDENNVKKPPLDFVLKIEGSFLLGFTGENNISEEHKKWKETIRSYGLTSIDNLDFVLSDMVKNGYVDTEKLKSAVIEKNNQIVARKSANSFYSAWDLYNGSFNNDKDKLINLLYGTFNENVKYISPRDLDSTVLFFRHFDENEKANTMIDVYIKNRAEDKDLFNVDSYSWIEPLKDSVVIEKFREYHNKVFIKKTAQEVLVTLSGKNGWSNIDEDILSNTSSDEYYTIFKSNEGKLLNSIVENCLEFRRISNPNEKIVEIVNRVENALKKIASESELNRYRISRQYNINV